MASFTRASSREDSLNALRSCSVNTVRNVLRIHLSFPSPPRGVWKSSFWRRALYTVVHLWVTRCGQRLPRIRLFGMPGWLLILSIDLLPSAGRSGPSGGHVLMFSYMF